MCQGLPKLDFKVSKQVSRAGLFLQSRVWAYTGEKRLRWTKNPKTMHHNKYECRILPLHHSERGGVNTDL